MKNHKVELYFPTSRGNGVEIPQPLYDEWLNAAKIVLANLFGGYTILEGQGGYMSQEHGRIIEEKVFVLYAYCSDNELREGAVQIRGFSRRLRSGLAQECVALVIDGDLEFLI